jgi:hypothetical protein
LPAVFGVVFSVDRKAVSQRRADPAPWSTTRTGSNLCIRDGYLDCNHFDLGSHAPDDLASQLRLARIASSSPD